MSITVLSLKINSMTIVHICFSVLAKLNEIDLKGIVHPKMKILSSFTHPQVVPNLYGCLWPAEHKRKIFWRKFVTTQFWGTIDFHSRKKIYGSQLCPRCALFPTFFRISSFVFARTKTFVQGWNQLRVSKWWQNFNFFEIVAGSLLLCENEEVMDEMTMFLIKAEKTVFPLRHWSFKCQCLVSTESFCAFLHNAIIKRPHQTGWPKKWGGLLPTCGPIKQLLCLLQRTLLSGFIIIYLQKNHTGTMKNFC